MDYSYQIPSYVYIFAAVIVLVAIGSIVFTLISKKKAAKYNESFLESNPDVGIIYLSSSNAGVVNENVGISTIDGQPPHFFNKGTKIGVYVTPGQHTVVMRYDHNRMGVVYRNVSKSTGEVEKQLQIEPRGRYRLGFDKKAESFTFEKITEEQA